MRPLNQNLTFNSIALFAFIIVIFIGVPYYGIILDGDELHSIIFSSGNRDYFNSGYEGLMHQKVNALEWKNQLSQVKNFDLVKVWNDTLLNDVHPPLYHLVLHVVLFLFGGSIIGAYLLNAFFLLASLKLISSKRNLTFGSNWKVIAFLPFILNGCLDIRPYCILFYLGLQCYFIFREQKINYFKMSIVIFLGLLTNYLFVLFVMALFYARIQEKGINMKTLIHNKIVIFCILSSFVLGYFILGQNDQFITITNRIDFDRHFIIDKLTNIVFSISGLTFPVWIFKLSNYFIIYMLLFSIGTYFSARLLMYFIRNKSEHRFEICSFLLYLCMYLILFFLEIIPQHSVGGKYFLLLSIPLIIPLMKMIKSWKYLDYIVPALLVLSLSGEALFRGDERKYISLMTDEKYSFYSNSNDVFTVLRVVHAMDDRKKIFIGSQDKSGSDNFDQLFIVTYKEPYIKSKTMNFLKESYLSKTLVLRKFNEIGTLYYK